MQQNQTMNALSHTAGSVINSTIADPSSKAADLDILEVNPAASSALDGGWFSRVATTSILLFGTFGNVMTVIILRRLRSSWSAMNVYLTALALSDTAMLYSGALHMWSRKVLRYDIYASHVIACKLGMWVVNTSASLSAWLLVALTAQRAASVVWPHRVNVICTRQKSVVIVVVIIVVCSLLYSHTLFGLELVMVENDKAKTCTFGSAIYQEFWISVWVRADTFIYSVLPCVCLIVSNSVLVWKLAVSVKEAKDKFSTGTGRGDPKGSRQKKASSVTVTIISVSVAFVVITVPTMMYNNFYLGSAPLDVHYFLYDLFFAFGLSNFAWNFYLYCLTGSRFRAEFKKIMFSRCMPVTSPERHACITEESHMSEVSSRDQQNRDVETNDDF